MCEYTRKPNNLAKLKDKRVMHQKLKSVGINYKSMTRQWILLRLKIFARQRNNQEIAKS